jgi:hypothetical protein
VFQDSINKTIKEYLVNFTYFTQLMEYYGFQLLKREDAAALGLPNGAGMFSELFTRMEQDVEQDVRQKNRYGGAIYMTPIEKQISFYNRYFVFKKVASVDVEDVFRSVTGIHVFQEKMNLTDSASVQKLASQFTGEGAAAAVASKGNVVMSYRASKVADLDKFGVEAGDSALLELEDLGSGISPKKKDATISKLFGSTKSSSKKSEASSKLVVKKKSPLEPVKMDMGLGATAGPGTSSKSAAASAAATSIIGKSTTGTKTSLSKLGKLSLGSSGAKSQPQPQPGSAKEDEE